SRRAPSPSASSGPPGHAGSEPGAVDAAAVRHGVQLCPEVIQLPAGVETPAKDSSGIVGVAADAEPASAKVTIESTAAVVRMRRAAVILATITHSRRLGSV